jgi:carbon storage regulator CsrA
VLILGRKTNEQVVITASNGERTVVTLMRDRTGRPMLGFEAPKSVNICRKELEDRNALRR